MKKLTNKEFIEKAKKIHGDKYDYSKIEYIKSQIKVNILCLKHGEFKQTPNDHLNGCGCRKCGIDSTKNVNKDTLNNFIKIILIIL